jgi:hypothetical protein
MWHDEMGHLHDVHPDVDQRSAALQVLATEHAPVGDAAPAQCTATHIEDLAEMPVLD